MASFAVPRPADATPRQSTAVLRRLLAAVPGHRRLLAAVALGAAVMALSTVALAFAAGTVVAHLVEHPGQWMRLTPWFLAGGILAALRGGADWARRRAAAVLGSRARRALRRQLLAQVVALSPRGLADLPPAALLTRALPEVEALALLLSTYLPQGVAAVAVPTVVAAAAFFLFWPAGVIFLVTAPLIPLFMTLIGRAALDRNARQWETLARLSAHFLDGIEGVLTLVAFNRARRHVETVRRVSEEYRRAVEGTLRLALLSALVLELAAAVATALVAVAVGLALMNHRLAFAPALAVLMLAPEFYAPQRQLGAAFHQAAAGLAAASEVFAVLDRRPPAASAGGRRLTLSQPPRFALRQVTVRYPGRSAPALSRLHLDIPAGRLTVVTGKSGAGKSTLLWCLLGLIEPDEGQVTVDGNPLCRLDGDHWRQQVGYLPQHPYFFAASLRENLALAAPAAGDQALSAALRRAAADQVVANLPAGLDTRLGARGFRLSAGEAQRLALARLFLRDPPVVLLDEPTEHLDPVTRAAVLPELARYLAGRTVVLVTHRPQEAALGDRVLVIGPTGEES